MDWVPAMPCESIGVGICCRLTIRNSFEALDLDQIDRIRLRSGTFSNFN